MDYDKELDDYIRRAKSISKDLEKTIREGIDITRKNLDDAFHKIWIKEGVLQRKLNRQPNNLSEEEADMISDKLDVLTEKKDKLRELLKKVDKENEKSVMMKEKSDKIVFDLILQKVNFKEYKKVSEKLDVVFHALSSILERNERYENSYDMDIDDIEQAYNKELGKKMNDFYSDFFKHFSKTMSDLEGGSHNVTHPILETFIHVISEILERIRLLGSYDIYQINKRFVTDEFSILHKDYYNEDDDDLDLPIPVKYLQWLTKLFPKAVMREKDDSIYLKLF